MDVVVVLLLVLLLYVFQRKQWAERLASANQYQQFKIGADYLDVLFAVHLALFLVYYTYAVLKFSDSFNYYEVSSNAEEWGILWGQDTSFINFVAWPFSHFIGFSYEATMLIFSYIGFQGILLFYFAAKENVYGLRPITGSYSLIEYLFLLPNLHFWTASIGKGSVITTGIAMVVYGLARYNTRKLLIAFGAFIVFMIRPHILFALVIGVGIAMLVSRRGVKTGPKIILILLSIFVVYFSAGNVLETTQFESLNVFSSAANAKALEYRIQDLQKARSGVDLQNYNQVQKIFTFLYRPLFFDAPGFLGIVVSFENFLMLLLTINLFRVGFVSWRYWNGWFRMQLFGFILTSLALAQVMSNMGIAMRQKAQVMPLFFILYARVMSLKDKKGWKKEQI